MKIPGTILAKYTFIDVVNYTKGRSVEAQSDVIDSLNALVLTVLERLGVPREERLFLPTGDGMCIAFLNYNLFDINVTFAFRLLELLAQHNAGEPDETRRFQIRVGINENQDNLINDINGNTNLAGNGINLAQRVMNLGNGSQILVGPASYEVLRGREIYMNHFREYFAGDKHGGVFYVYQLIDPEIPYLNCDIPRVFAAEAAADAESRPLTEICAWTIAIANKRHEFFYSKKDEPRFRDVTNTLLYHLALDQISRKKSTPFKRQQMRTYKAGFAPIQDQYNYYKAQDFNIVAVLAEFIFEAHYKEFAHCFEGDAGQKVLAFPSALGLAKMREQFPHLEEEIRNL